MEASGVPPPRDGWRPPGSPPLDLDVLRDDLAKIASQTIVEIRTLGAQIETACREESSRGAEQSRQTLEEIQAMKHELQTLAETVEGQSSGAPSRQSAHVMSKIASAFTGGGRSESRHFQRNGKRVDRRVPKGQVGGSRHTLTAAELKQKAAMKERVAALPPRQEAGKPPDIGSKITAGTKKPAPVNALSGESDSDEEQEHKEAAIAPMQQEGRRWTPLRPQGFEERPFTPQEAPALLLNQEVAGARRGAWCDTIGELRTAAKTADDGDSLPNVTVRESDWSQRSSEQSLLATLPNKNLHHGQPVPVKTHTMLLGDGLKGDSDGVVRRPGSFNSDAEQGERQKRASRAAHARMTLRLELRKAKSQIKMKTDDSSGRLSLDTGVSGAERVPSWRRTASRVLHSNRFDNTVSLMIMLNAVTIGFETDICAIEVHDRSGSCEDPDTIWRMFEVFFCVVFTAELMLRIYVRRGRFLLDRKWSVLWNWFDFVVVMTQLAQEGINVLSSSKVLDVKSFRVIRVLRILRVVRIFRLVRVLHLISELRTIVSSILGSFKSLAWTAVLLFLMIYIVSVYFTQTITDHMAENPKAGTPSDDRQNLRYFYGSLTKTILALWQSITGGADWDQMARPMIHEVSPMLGLAFCAYIAFAILALMNVVTGVFVQTALQSAQHEEDSFLTDQIISLFQMAKGDKSARITLDEIQQKVNDPAAAKEWKSINVSADEATYLFDLLDIDQSGDVYFEEFLSACIRLRGPAKSIDTLTMMQEARARYRQWQIAFEDIERLMAAVLQNQECLRQMVEFRGSKDNELEARTRFLEAIVLGHAPSGSTGSLAELPGVEAVLKGEEV